MYSTVLEVRGPRRTARIAECKLSEYRSTSACTAISAECSPRVPSIAHPRARARECAMGIDGWFTVRTVESGNGSVSTAFKQSTFSKQTKNFLGTTEKTRFEVKSLGFSWYPERYLAGCKPPSISQFTLRHFRRATVGTPNEKTGMRLAATRLEPWSAP